MEISNKKKSNRVALLIVLSFAAGFGAATGAYFFILCEECFDPDGGETLSTEEKCEKSLTICINATKSTFNSTIASKIGHEKVKFLEKLVKKPIIQNALKDSNQKNKKMDEDIRNQINVMREKTWTTSINPTPFMMSIFGNDVADFLRENHVTPHEEFGDVVFGEHILTNIYGPNVAVSVITDNYLQSNDEWWQKAFHDPEHEPFARECEFDSSAQMFSEDLVISIFDEKGKLIGIMNSATPCNVTQDYLDADKSIQIVREERISDIGKHKIFVLQELMKDPAIQETLIRSNQEFLSFTNEELLELKEKKSWPKPQEEPTGFQLSIIKNEVADILRDNLKVESDDYGDLQFPEMILTNSKGANVASTDRTYNYIQFFDEWWIVASENKVLVRECGYDRSIQMNSEDIIIQIFDKNDEFIGILNSASTCDVISDKPALFFGDSN
jgi:hypothetical protein